MITPFHASNKFSLRNIDNVYMFILLLYAGRSCKIASALMHPTNFFSTLFFIILTVILLRRHHFVFGEKFYWIIMGTTIWVLLQILKTGNVEPMTLFLYLEITIAYIVANIYGTKILLYFEKYTTWLAFLSLVVWTLYLFFPNLLLGIMRPFNLRDSNYIIQASVIITSISGTTSFLGMRNAGFCSEPGYYASFLCIAIAINLVIHKFDIKFNNKSFYILLFSLLTTQSTTGYLGGGIIFLFYLLNVSHVSKLLSVGLMTLLIPSIMALPFMREKIEDYWYEEGNEYEIAEAADKKEYVFVPQRIDGLVLEGYNIIYDPWLGYGLKSKHSYVGKSFSQNIVLSNGSLQVFSAYGIPLGILFYIGLCITLRKLTLLERISGWYILLLLFITLSCSYNFNMVPFLLSIWQMAILRERKDLSFV